MDKCSIKTYLNIFKSKSLLVFSICAFIKDFINNNNVTELNIKEINQILELNTRICQSLKSLCTNHLYYI